MKIGNYRKSIKQKADSLKKIKKMRKLRKKRYDTNY